MGLNNITAGPEEVIRTAVEIDGNGQIAHSVVAVLREDVVNDLFIRIGQMEDVVRTLHHSVIESHMDSKDLIRRLENATHQQLDIAIASKMEDPGKYFRAKQEADRILQEMIKENNGQSTQTNKYPCGPDPLELARDCPTSGAGAPDSGSAIAGLDRHER